MMDVQGQVRVTFSGERVNSGWGNEKEKAEARENK